METINISKFRANLLKYLEKVKQGNTLNITSHGETLATVVPPLSQSEETKIRLQEIDKYAAF